MYFAKNSRATRKQDLENNTLQNRKQYFYASEHTAFLCRKKAKNNR